MQMGWAKAINEHSSITARSDIPSRDDPINAGHEPALIYYSTSRPAQRLITIGLNQRAQEILIAAPFTSQPEFLAHQVFNLRSQQENSKLL